MSGKPENPAELCLDTWEIEIVRWAFEQAYPEIMITGNPKYYYSCEQCGTKEYIVRHQTISFIDMEEEAFSKMKQNHEEETEVTCMGCGFTVMKETEDRHYD